MKRGAPVGVFGAAALLAAFGASLCCMLPLAVAVLGVGSAALGAQLEPLRPWLGGLAAVLFGIAFYRAYRPARCAPGDACALPAGRTRRRVMLWIAAFFALAAITLPYYASRLF